MKKNKLLLIFISFVVLFSMTGCGNKNDDKKDLEQGKDELKDDIKEDVSSEPKYLTDEMKLYDEVEQLNGQIKDIFIDMHRVITNDNKIYEYFIDVEEISNLDIDVDKILNNYTDGRTMASLVENKDGSISYINSEGEIEYTVDLDNIIFASSSYVFTLEDGYLYSYKMSDGQLGTKEQVYLQKERNGGKTFYDAKVEVEYIPDCNYMYFELDNGDIRFYSNDYNNRKDEGYGYFAIAAGEKKYMTGKELSRILYHDSMNDAIFATKEKNTSLYYFDESGFSTIGDSVECIKNKGEVGCYESIKREIPLPEGYTVDDIERVLLAGVIKYDINIITKDGKIYYYEGNNEWVEFEYLSQLYKENHIVELKREYGEILVLCDDGYLYEYDF